MPLIRVDLYGIFRPAGGDRSLTLELPAGKTVRDLLFTLAARRPDLGVIFDSAGNLFAYIPVFVNGRNPRLLPGGLETPLCQNDIVSLFSPIASGKLNVEELKRA